MTSNDERAEHARAGLFEYAETVYSVPQDRDLDDPTAFEQALSDFLCDVMHLADKYNALTWPICLGRARANYEEEKEQDGEVTPMPEFVASGSAPHRCLIHRHPTPRGQMWHLTCDHCPDFTSPPMPFRYCQMYGKLHEADSSEALALMMGAPVDVAL